MTEFKHISVLKEEIISALSLKSGDLALDCTAGGGGHTQELLKRVQPSGKVYAIDRDHSAISFLQKKFKDEIDIASLELLHAPFDQASSHLNQLNLKFSGIIADLGVSSPQLDQAERGFSFMQDGPLDMRMSQESGSQTAQDIVMNYPKEELFRIFKQYGEEPKASIIAREICLFREKNTIDTTTKLAELIKNVVHYKTKSKKHPATKVFQALRIEVNNELEQIELLIDEAIELLAPGGRLAIITFHSLEDKIVKNKFKFAAGIKGYDPILNALPLTDIELSQRKNIVAKIVKPFPMKPSEHEIKLNPRSRSAKLRVLEKI